MTERVRCPNCRTETSIRIEEGDLYQIRTCPCGGSFTVEAPAGMLLPRAARDGRLEIKAGFDPDDRQRQAKVRIADAGKAS